MLYEENKIHRPNNTRPPPNLIEGEEFYKVEAITMHHENKRTQKTEYWVRWKGYRMADDTWELEENLASSAKKMLKGYKGLHGL